MSVQECGLFIDAQRPWLAASPDGIVTDKETGQRLLCLEVKCPYKHKDRRVEDACREDRAFCLEILDQDRRTPGQVNKLNILLFRCLLSPRPTTRFSSSCPLWSLMPPPGPSLQSEDVSQLLHTDPVSAGGDGSAAGRPRRLHPAGDGHCTCDL